MVEPWYYLIGFIFGYCTLCHWIGPPKDNPKTKWPTKYRKRESRWVYLKLCLTVTTPIPMTWSFCWEKPMGQSCKFLTNLTPTKFSSSAASVYPKYSSRNKCQKGKHHLNHWTGQSSATEFGTNADGLLMAEIQSNGWPVEISTLSHDLPSPSTRSDSHGNLAPSTLLCGSTVFKYVVTVGATKKMASVCKNWAALTTDLDWFHGVYQSAEW